MTKIKKPVLHANLADRVGSVRTYACPICLDGERLKELEARLKAAEAVCESAASVATEENVRELRQAVKERDDLRELNLLAADCVKRAEEAAIILNGQRNAAEAKLKSAMDAAHWYGEMAERLKAAEAVCRECETVDEPPVNILTHAQRQALKEWQALQEKKV